MKRQDFDFDLPPELIAQLPLPDRTASRLLHLNGVDGSLTHLQFAQIKELLRPGDLLVFNDTKVMRARLFGQKETGGKVELLIERVIDDERALAQMRSSKPFRAGQTVMLDDDHQVEIIARHDALYELRFLSGSVHDTLDAIGHIPLPPYIERTDNDDDHARYQTVYAKNLGAVAAPTAGLHFDQTILDELAALGVEKAFVTLHVGAGTFKPVRADDIRDHHMHSERYEISEGACEKIFSAQARGSRVISVGTTSLRVLESCARAGKLIAGSGETDIFIYPGYQFRVVDALITNFHLPESTLLMLVSAFAGTDHIKQAYAEAIAQRYRFFSYGDAMFIEKQLL